jgi:hypothetical protein
MNRHAHWLCFFLLAHFFFLGQIAVAQSPPIVSSSSPGFKPGLRFDYFSRTVSWDGEKSKSQLSSYVGSLILGYEIQPGFFLAAIVGYSSSTFDGLVFRKLPLSIDLEGGGINGLVFGAQINKSLLSGKRLDIDILGQFLAYQGAKKKWDIPGLAVPGTLEGTPTWMRASIGPVLTYRSSKNFSPYLYPSFDYLWGTFEMKETVQSLQGLEKKEIKAKIPFGIAAGASVSSSAKLTINAEVGVYPYNGGVDYSALIIALFSF